MKSKFNFLLGHIIPFSVALIVVVVTFYNIFFYKYLKAQIEKMKVKTKNFKSITYYSSMPSEESKFKKIKVLLDKYFIKETDIVLILQEIANIATSRNISNLEYIFFKKQKTANYYALPILIKYNSTFSSSAVFLQRLTELDRLIKIDNIHLEREKHSGVLTTNIKIQIYFDVTEFDNKKLNASYSIIDNFINNSVYTSNGNVDYEITKDPFNISENGVVENFIPDKTPMDSLRLGIRKNNKFFNVQQIDNKNFLPTAKTFVSLPILVKKTNVKSKVNFILSGILYSDEIKAAILNKKVYKEGDKLGNYIVKSIEPQQVILSDGENEVPLEIKKQ